jgi:Rrf2 family iron-sulfur cluster assembly transcriptional regulator
MIDVCRNSEDGTPVQLKNIAKRAGLSKGYLEQLATALRHASLLRGISGPKGGYLLAKSAGSIKVIDIIEAAIGPIALTSCVMDPGVCVRSDTCECTLIWKLLNNHIRATLDRHSLEDMVQPSWRDSILKEMEGSDNHSQVSGTDLWPCQQQGKG